MNVVAEASLAIVVPCLDGAGRLDQLVPRLQAAVDRMRQPAEIVLVHPPGDAAVPAAAARRGVRSLSQQQPGYGGALMSAIRGTSAPLVITVEDDAAHAPELVPYLFEHRDTADIVIASRYVRQGFSRMPWFRVAASRCLNAAFRVALDLPIRDLSSGYRLYRRTAIESLRIESTSYAVLQEILIKAYCEGFAIVEIPMHYVPGARDAQWRARALLGRDYLRTFARMWTLRNSVDSCDYDTRAFFSKIPLQRYWQRRRYSIITGYIGHAARVLDAGCGSTQILNGRPQIIGIDPQRRKLRYMRAPGRRLVNASTFALPFRDGAFDVVVSSQVVEHLPQDPVIFSELVRCVRPGGALVLGTVDYGGWQWPLIERAYALAKPTGYAHEHITHYTRDSLFALLRNHGLDVVDHQYILGGEIVIKALKRMAPAAERPHS